MKIKAFITHKAAEQYSDCQDRFAINPDNRTIAVSDGISQSLNSKIWADILTKEFVKQPWGINETDNFASVHEKFSQEWKSSVENIQSSLSVAARNYTERMLAEGKSAGATFLGVQFDGLKWNGTVLGDSCLIEIRDNEIFEIYTSQEGRHFNFTPDYYDSDPNKPGNGKEKQICGELALGITLLLVSDPFSDLFAENRAKSSGYIKELRELKTHEEYISLVDRWRKEYRMHNDDSTIVIIEYDGSNDFVLEHQDDIEKLVQKEREEKEQNKTKTTQSTSNAPWDRPKSSGNTSVLNRDAKEELLENFLSEAEQVYIGKRDSQNSWKESFKRFAESLIKLLKKNKNKNRQKVDEILTKKKETLRKLLEPILEEYTIQKKQ